MADDPTTGTVGVGATVAIPITVHTPADAPALVGLSAAVTGPGIPLAAGDVVFVVGE